ncbi:glutaredoxin family protein [Endozoicomonas sp. SM1973]|uniref:Glutaredoxin family protein n=1 Tax=Spartinivicinus marinus TaxID=2994442 RepID=A0A853HZW6_9GAMM|nr:glutaredoxin family protein [Spartinivicinus marinus]MCX4029193.1 glutaredoxin family protein [Spartinivicinus marinus]NYZ65899.1 glutaredoxin family protein [Spartinivicinus marinus]
MSSVILYTTTGCHLCDQALALLQPVAERYHFTITAQEIAFDPDLFDRYGIRIPVIALANQQAELGWPFTAEELDQFIVTQLEAS